MQALIDSPSQAQKSGVENSVKLRGLGLRVQPVAMFFSQPFIPHLPD